MTRPSEAVGKVELNDLRAGSLIDVETRSRFYHIECLGGNVIRISGHPEYCPRPEVGQLYGAMDNQGAVELGVIEPGMRLTFFVNDRPFTTSRVVSIHVGYPEASTPNSAASVH